MKWPAVGAMTGVSLVALAASFTLGGLNARTPTQSVNSDFVVTSSRDAGPGTLRDALLAAERLSRRGHIVITAKRITLESALPPLGNPRGIEIEAAAQAGVIDAARLKSGTVLRIDSPTSLLRGLHVLNAHDTGVLVNAPGVQIESLTVSDSRIGLLLSAAATGCVVRTSTLEHDETGLMVEAGARNLGVFSTIFHDNSRAGFWSVAAAVKTARATNGAGEQYVTRIVDGVFEKNGSGVVLANRPTLIQKSRFLTNRESAVLVLGGRVGVEDSEIRASGGNAISITSGTSATVIHNTFIANPATALSVRDSEILIEKNQLSHNGFGIVAVVNRGTIAPIIRNNVITQSSADAVTLIGGEPLLESNQLTDNHGAGLRALNLVQAGLEWKVSPRLQANLITHNGIDVPPTGVYKLSGGL